MSEDIVSHEDIFPQAPNTTYQIGYKDIRSNKSFVLVRPRGNFSRGVVTLHKKDALEQVVIDKELHDKLVKAAKDRATAQEVQETKHKITRKRKRSRNVDDGVSSASATPKVPKKRKPGRPKGSRTLKREEGTDDVESSLLKAVPHDDTSLNTSETGIPSAKNPKRRSSGNSKQQQQQREELDSQGYSSSASLGSIPPSENEDSSASDDDGDDESDTDYHTDAEELGPNLTAATSSDSDEYDNNDDDDEDFYMGKRSGQNGNSKRVSFRSQRSGTKATTVAIGEGRRTRRGRPKRLGSDNGVESPATPQKFAPRTDHQFSSPLRRIIRENLREYRDTTATMQLTLSKNFVPTPLPTNIDHEYIQNLQRNRQENDFFDTFEGYLSQRKMVKRADKPRSKNTMALAPEITREEFALVTNLFNENFHKRTREALFQIQRRMFPQYWFELTQGFSLLFYGIGSKRHFLERFALEYLVPRLSQPGKAGYDKGRSTTTSSGSNTSMTIPCIIVNGYNPSCVYREVFRAVSKIMFPQEIYGDDSKFWGNLCMLQVQRMVEFYKDKPPDIKLVLLVHNIDGPGVRKGMFQTLLSSLGVIRQIALIASADHIYAPVLWDNMKSQNYNFVYHDVTDYAPRVVESTFQDSMKLGKSDGISASVDGVKYVLESLTKNSKRLYKLLLETQIQNMDKALQNTVHVSHKSSVGDDATEATTTTASSGRRGIDARHGTMATGIDMKKLQQMCADEFIASNEISLRTMLREFVEHKMAYMSKNTSGLEIVWVAYRYSDIRRLLKTVLDEIE